MRHLGSPILFSFSPFALIPLLLLSLTLAGCDTVSTEVSVYTETGPGGQLSPDQRQINADSSTFFSIQPEPGYELKNISGCNGRQVGERYITGPISSRCTVSAEFQLSEHKISTRVHGGGSITPSSTTLTVKETARFTLLPDDGFRVAEVSGCAGVQEEDSYVLKRVSASCTVTATFEPETYQLSGEIRAAALITLDNTLNDQTAADLSLSEMGDNNDFETAQPVNNRAIVSGFASAVGTRESCHTGFQERYRNEPDKYDFFRVSLQKGQLVQLQVANYARQAGVCEGTRRPRPLGDLTLTLFTNPEMEWVAGTQGGAEYQEIRVPASGDYYVQVQAMSGISRYILRFLPDDAPAATDFRHTVTGEFVPGEMLVKHRARQDKNRASPSPERIHRESIAPFSARLSASESGLSTRAMETLRQHNPRAHAKVETLAALRTRRADPAVEYAEPNYIRTALHEPNDPGFVRQWHYQAISLPQAWNITSGHPQEGPAPIVAILDTGVVLEHPDLMNQLVPGYDFVRDPQRSGDGTGGIDPDPSDPGDSDGTRPDSWHGTHVAGIVAADTDNGLGGAGVSWGARIMPVRVLGIGGGTSYDVLQGVRFAAGLVDADGLPDNDSHALPERRADIINLSLGGPGFSQAEAELYARVRAEGVLLVAASGNEGSSRPFYPAAYSAVLSVGATNALGQRAPYSNFGDTLDLVAPGGYLGQDATGSGNPDGIFSTSAERRGSNIQPRYSLSYQGTSMAAPHVSGVLALMKAVYPELSPSDVDRLLVNGLLTGRNERDSELGYGQIDAYLSVMAVQNGEFDPTNLPPQLRLSPARLNLGTTLEGTITLSNQGGGEPRVTEVTTEEPWLEVLPSAETADSSDGLGSYQVRVDRRGLDDGYYQGRAMFTLDDGTQTRLRVYMQVGGLASEGELAPLYALLMDPEGEVVQQALAKPSPQNREIARFEFSRVPPGRYTLVAGSDIDADDIICQTAEQCGAYPSLERQQTIEVTDSDRTDLDFIATVLGGLTDSRAQRLPDEPTFNPGYPRRSLNPATDRRSPAP